MDTIKPTFAIPSLPTRFQHQNSQNNQQRGRGVHRGFSHRPPRGDPHNSPSRPQGDHHGQSRGRGRGRFRGGRGRGHAHVQGEDRKQQWHQKQQPVAEIKTKFYCCACDRAFKTQEEKDEHDSEHIICGLNGCQFEAHALVVTKHVKMQHTDGLYERIKNLNTPEDIQAWKEERKKNFPTLENLQKKNDERKEKEERRELYGVRGRGAAFQPPSQGEPVFRYKIPPADKLNQMQYYQEQRMRKIEYRQGDGWMHRSFAPDLKFRHIRVPFASMNKSPIVTLESFYLSVKKGKDGRLEKTKKAKWNGFKVKTLELLPNSESEGEDEELPISDSSDEDCAMDDDSETMIKEKRPSESTPSDPKTNAVDSQPQSFGLSLVNYSSASESENEDISDKDTVPLQSSHKEDTKSSLEENKLGGSCDDQDDSESSENEMVIEEFDQVKQPKLEPLAQRRTLSTRRNRNYQRSRLLERLLHDPIRKERNIILQACRFLCENNFFMDNKTDTSSSSGVDMREELTDSTADAASMLKAAAGVETNSTTASQDEVEVKTSSPDDASITCKENSEKEDIASMDVQME
ncbi:Nuclear fragile X mental retardation-interacting protein 1 [Orchesella cincta]|uniref:Nuclear fragile X mental retardation-interacting protein 1 n=1 Tax=Orchesella cincta TaxID=48709 RepID=A0A1D2MZ14_ORCCI|nr:Nuclear fragile X mental retardation-interacting protein 1 [Orchesella cincta]